MIGNLYFRRGNMNMVFRYSFKLIASDNPFREIFHFYIKSIRMRILFFFLCSFLIACSSPEPEAESKSKDEKLQIIGTWKLLSATTIKPDTTIVDSVQHKEVIKIINPTHFAFLNHDLYGGKDSAKAFFVAGGGSYTLKGNAYQEKLNYCNFREWEGHTFDFTLTLNNDTLVQKGVEKVEELGIEHFLIEKYIRVKE